MFRHLPLLVLLVTVAASCGVSNRRGECKEYKPLRACVGDQVYTCETTKEGCRQCTCVPAEDADEIGDPYPIPGSR